MLSFAKIEGNSSKYPRQTYDGKEDQAYGFVPAFKLQTGNTRGTQTVGYGGAKIDGANNRITITDPASGDTIGFGAIPNTTNEFGFFSLDSDGTLIFKIVNGTLYMYDAITGINNLQLGKLPDGTTNLAIAKEGEDITEAF